MTYEDWDDARLRHESHDPEARWVHDAPTAVYVCSSPQDRQEVRQLDVARAASFGTLFLIEDRNEPDDWYMGEADSDGVIRCWGTYGTLSAAIKSL